MLTFGLFTFEIKCGDFLAFADMQNRGLINQLQAIIQLQFSAGRNRFFCGNMMFLEELTGPVATCSAGAMIAPVDLFSHVLYLYPDDSKRYYIIKTNLPICVAPSGVSTTK